jgi:hypothetical protein
VVNLLHLAGNRQLKQPNLAEYLKLFEINTHTHEISVLNVQSKKQQKWEYSFVNEMF